MLLAADPAANCVAMFNSLCSARFSGPPRGQNPDPTVFLASARHPALPGLLDKGFDW
jgi:hypothetical protein